MLKIILDTNVIISFLVTDSDCIKKIIDLRNLQKLDLYCSLEIFEELKNSLQKPKIKDILKVNPKKVASFVAFYKYKVKFTKPSALNISRDPRDDKFLELAKEIKADYLITGDKDLLVLKTFENTVILKPSEFINVINSSIIS